MYFCVDQRCLWTWCSLLGLRSANDLKPISSRPVVSYPSNFLEAARKRMVWVERYIIKIAWSELVEATLYFDKKVSYYKYVVHLHSSKSNSEQICAAESLNYWPLVLHPRVSSHVGFCNKSHSLSLVTHKICFFCRFMWVYVGRSQKFLVCWCLLL